MKESVLKLDSISKTYSGREVISNVTFDINSGEICGLVGENGAGKTTIIRILSGLTQQNSGKILGKQDCKMSSIVEAPSLYPNLSAYDNLKYQALWCGIQDSQTKIRNILELIGLSDIEHHKKVKNFSLGMKQRLAIGVLLVDEPNVLILDEPINGLDPVGIKDIRNMILTLKEKYNMAILISSHILSELEMIADKYVIISKGQIIETLDSNNMLQKLKTHIVLNSSNQQLSLSTLEKSNYICTVEDDKIHILGDEKDVTPIIDLLRHNNIFIYDIYQRQISFEDYYLSLINQKEGVW